MATAKKEQRGVYTSELVQQSSHSMVASRQRDLDAELSRQHDSCKEENDNNITEVRRQQGEKLHYGDTVQLQHVASGALFV